jgi:hypothetical protein
MPDFDQKKEREKGKGKKKEAAPGYQSPFPPPTCGDTDLDATQQQQPRGTS